MPDRFSDAMTDEDAGLRSLCVGYDKHGVEHILAALDGVTGDSGAGRLDASIPRNPAKQPVARKDNAAAGSDRDGKEVLPYACCISHRQEYRKSKMTDIGPCRLFPLPSYLAPGPSVLDP
jgi:hypothetical protein